jgi:hypothetical protein
MVRGRELQRLSLRGRPQILQKRGDSQVRHQDDAGRRPAEHGRHAAGHSDAAAEGRGQTANR